MPLFTLSEPQAWAIGCAFVLMAMDIVTGLVAALINSEFSSSKMREGLGHKAMLACVIVLACVLEMAGAHIAGLGFSGVTIVAVCVYICAMEVGSIMENICSAYPELKGTALFNIFNSKED